MIKRNLKGQFVKGCKINLGRKRSEEFKRKNSEAKKGKNHPNWGKHLSEETKQKIGLANSISHMGNIPWNKGIAMWEDREHPKGMLGKIAWNKGKKCPQLSGKNNPFYGKKHSENTKKKLRKATISNPPKIFKDTSIELKIEEELKKRNIIYQKQVPLCRVAIVDFYLPEYRIVIQCDGDYWHNLSDHKERDEKQDRVLTFNGFNVYRFWEHEINKSVKNCINKIKFYGEK